MVEFEQEVEININLEVLQFVGIADHSQLHNRDIADQHTISSITGLEDKFSEYDKSLEQLTKDMENTVDEKLETHTKMLESQASAIKSLQDFSENIATVDNTQEVLNDGE